MTGVAERRIMVFFVISLQHPSNRLFLKRFRGKETSKGIWRILSFIRYFQNIFDWQNRNLVLFVDKQKPLYSTKVHPVPDSVQNSKSTASDGVPVRVRSPAPNQYNPNLVFPVGDGFGLFVFFGRFEESHFRNGVIKRPESKPRGPRKKKRI